MASTVLYPPNLDPILPAFVATGDKGRCRVYFTLSKYSSTLEPIKSIHLSVIKQSNGMSVVKKVDDAAAGRFRSAGILIINTGLKRVPASQNLYYVDILSSDIAAGDDDGWQVGWIYKIQLRLSTVAYDGVLGQAQWLNVQASNFSEWSTFATTKATAKPTISIPVFNDFNSNNEVNSIYSDLSISTLDFYGTYQNTDLTETLYSYEVSLLKGEETLEQSGIRYGETFDAQNTFSYNFTTELEEGNVYTVKFTYETNNKYTETFEFNFTVKQEQNTTDIIAVTLENAAIGSTLGYENDEGCIGIKFGYAGAASNESKTFYLKRASSKDNFKTWLDIQLFNSSDGDLDSIPIYYDRTIESGVFYQYGVQEIKAGARTIINKNNEYNIRETEYSYLIGEGGKSLRLTYDAGVSTFTTVKTETKTNVLGSKYPYLFRGASGYKEFPLSGIISFTMDTHNTFMSDDDYYSTDNIKDLYEDYYLRNNISIYNYKKEFDFRTRVLDFLQDGKPKLFKSATEGNILVILTNVSLSPIQNINRLVANFSATATEIDECTYENLLKYNITHINEYTEPTPEPEIKEGALTEATLITGNELIDYIKELHTDKDIDIIKVNDISLTFVEEVNVQYYSFVYNGRKVLTGSSFTFDEGFELDNQDSLLIGDPVMTEGEIVTLTAKISCTYSYTEKDKDNTPETRETNEYGIGRSESTPTVDSLASKYLYVSPDKTVTLTDVEQIDGTNDYTYTLKIVEVIK